MELFVIIVTGLTVSTKGSNLDVAAVLDPPLTAIFVKNLHHISITGS